MIKKSLKISATGGWPRGRVVRFARSAAGGPVFRRFESWAPTWHCSSDHAEAASHMPQLEEPTTKNTQLCTGGRWGEKGKKKKKRYILNLQIFTRDFLKLSSYGSFFSFQWYSNATHCLLSAHPRNVVKPPGKHPGLYIDQLEMIVYPSMVSYLCGLFEGRSFFLLILCNEGQVQCLTSRRYLINALNCITLSINGRQCLENF